MHIHIGEHIHTNSQPREMAQKLIAPVTLPEDHFIPSTHSAAHYILPNSVTPGPGGSSALYWLPWALHANASFTQGKLAHIK